MPRSLLAAALFTGAAASAFSSWTIQASPTTERRRGVSAVSDTVAGASGNKGTVVRTTDGGARACRKTEALNSPIAPGRHSPQSWHRRRATLDA